MLSVGVTAAMLDAWKEAVKPAGGGGSAQQRYSSDPSEFHTCTEL
jgi:hypothetical protein